jgi:peptidoglycan/xylan/chitin deacetylase (PgdA/CDA1 family)
MNKKTRFGILFGIFLVCVIGISLSTTIISDTLSSFSSIFVSGSVNVTGNLTATTIYENGLGIHTPSTEEINLPTETVISNFQKSHGFVKQSVAGTQYDSGDYFKGNSSLELISDGAGSAVFTRKSSMTPIDLRNRYLKIWIKVNDTSNVLELWVYASSDNFDGTSYYTWKVSDDISFFPNNTWTAVTLPFGSDNVTSGTPNRSLINSFQLRIKDKSAGLIAVYFGGLSYIEEPLTGVVSFTFDDGYFNTYSEGRNRMDAYGFTGTVYVIPSKIGVGGYLSLNQVKEMYASGWDISAHYGSDFSHTDQSLCEQQVLSVKNYLLSNGFTRGANEFAYPNGYFQEPVLSCVKKYFHSARTIVDFRETVSPADTLKLRAFLVTNTTTDVSLETVIDEAKTNKEWLILIFHHLVDSANVSTQYNVLNFTTILNYINASGIPVKTVSQVLNSNYKQNIETFETIKMNTNTTVMTCNSLTEGEMIYDAILHKSLICNSTDWNTLW